MGRCGEYNRRDLMERPGLIGYDRNARQLGSSSSGASSFSGWWKVLTRGRP